MEIKDLYKTLQRLKIVTKHGMTSICVLMTAHCGMLFFGYDFIFVHILFWLYIACMGIQLSKVFNLCWVHRLSVVYSMSVIMCVLFQRYGMFEKAGIDIHIFRGIMFALGIIVVCLNIWKMNLKNCSENC